MEQILHQKDETDKQTVLAVSKIHYSHNIQPKLVNKYPMESY
jgi:hypothetical protein